MNFVYNIILILHFVGLAAILGGFIAQVKSPDKQVTNAMWHGTLLQVVTAILMVMFAEAKWVDEPLNHAVIGIKSLILLAILVIAIVSRRKQAPQVGAWAAVGLLTFANICIAVLAGVTVSN